MTTAPKACQVPKCGGKHKAFGLCTKHYRALYYQNHKATECARARGYKKTFYGRILVAYQKLRLRCEGRGGYKSKSYEGLQYLPQDEFIAWATTDPVYLRIFNEWVASGYLYRLTPTPDRVDPNLGYSLTNLRWLTFSENVRLRRDVSSHYRQLLKSLP
jgi:hypothetical protein